MLPPTAILMKEYHSLPKSPFTLLKSIFFQPLLYCAPQKSLIMLECSGNQNQLSLALLAISLPKTSDFALLPGPSLQICQSQSASQFLTFLTFPIQESVCCSLFTPVSRQKTSLQLSGDSLSRKHHCFSALGIYKN